MQIVAIGGGEIKDKETLCLDRHIVDLTGKSSPKALFIPTASSDAEGYCETFDRIYGHVLGCRTDHLLLLNRADDVTYADDKIFEADIVYVGGGNTLKMMKLWRKLGIDRMLEKAGKRGAILSGLSAGAICWHMYGHSDSRSFSGNSDWPFVRVKGLGFCPGMFCPHLDAEQRQEPFSQMIARFGGTGIACDNNAAIWYNNSKMIVKSSNQTASVYIYKRQKGVVQIEKYSNDDEIGITG